MKFLDKLLNVKKSGENGLYVSRPVLNAQEWTDWAVKYGIPSPADDLHVTIVYSQTDAKIALANDPLVISTAPDYWCAGRFGFLGPDNQALCFIFSSWVLQDRFYAYSANGTTATYPEYVPHMTLSMDAKGFDLPDAALADCPEYIVLGGEVRSDLRQPDASDQMIDDDEGINDDDGDAIIIVLASVKEAAGKALESVKASEDGFQDVNPAQVSALMTIAHDKPLTKRAAKRLAKATWAPELLKNILVRTEARGLTPPAREDAKAFLEATKANKKPYGDVAYADPGYVDGVYRYPIDTEQHIRAAWSYIHHVNDRKQYTSEQLDHIEGAIIAAWKDKIDKGGPPAADQPPAGKKTKAFTGQIVQITPALAKAAFKGVQKDFSGFDEERRWVYGIASVSTINGEEVDDLDGDTISTKCLEEYCAELLKSQAGGDFEHETEAVNTIVGALCFSTDLQKALGIDLGMELLLTVTHVPADDNWEKVKTGEWMQSIAGEFYYED